MKDLGEETVAHIGKNSVDGTRLAWKKILTERQM